MPRPLLAALPVAPISYPILDGGGNVISETKEWSTGPFGCFGMNDLGLSCCCANCCLGWWMWGNSLDYMSIGSTSARFSSAAAGIDFGDGGGAQGVEALAKVNALIVGQKKRAELVRALGLYREGDEGLCLRCCCMSCVQCQEVDTVFTFYRDSLGYRDLAYGSCLRCQCTRWYSGGRLVHFPFELFKGESVGPNYPATDLPNGYYFDAGVPTQMERDAPRGNYAGGGRVKS